MAVLFLDLDGFKSVILEKISRAEDAAGDNAEDLLKSADTAMYQAKQAGEKLANL